MQRQLDGAPNAKWLGMLAAHRTKTLDTATLIEGVKVLFVGKTSLLMQLNQFLPRESRLTFSNLAPNEGGAEARCALAAAESAAPPFASAASPAASPPSAAHAGADDMLAHLTEPGWRTALQREVTKPYFCSMVDRVATERERGAVYPPADKVFSAAMACRSGLSAGVRGRALQGQPCRTWRRVDCAN